MKRSEINKVIEASEAFMAKNGCILPPFASWTPEQWAKMGTQCDEIRDNRLGWDVTDFGCNDFARIGLTAFTLRNGNRKQLAKYPKPYAEKYLIAQEEQHTPMHFHSYKMEDIINRGGGILVMRLYCANEADEPDRTRPVSIVSDGVALELPAGAVIELKPGQSITYTPRLYHEFWAKAGFGPVLIGEVSMCNDDETDNHFFRAPGRFPAIDEDVKPYRLLCNEYPRA